MNVHLRLRVKLPWGEEQLIPFQGREMVLGRGSECDIMINDPEVSRKHAKLTYISPEKIGLVDVGSTNGTFVRGMQVNTETFLNPGSAFKIGETSIIFESAAGEDFRMFHVEPEHLIVKPWHGLPDQMADSSADNQNILTLVHDLLTVEKGLNNLNALADLINRIFKSENACIIMIDSGEWTAQGLTITRGKQLFFPVEVLDEILYKGKCVLISNQEAFSCISQKEKGPRTAICAPIRDKGQILGTIYLDRKQKNAPFKEEDLNFLCEIGHLLALFFNNEKSIQTMIRERDGLRQEREKLHKMAITTGELPVKSQNKKYQQLLFKAMRVAGTDHPILLTGSIGTGRRMLANRIHSQSSRKEMPFIFVDCANIPQPRIEEDLFGYEVPSEESTLVEKPGFVELANGGTLFLREISALPVFVQNKLVELLQTKKFNRKGGHQWISSDVRLIASTDVDVQRMVNAEMMHPFFYDVFKDGMLEVPPIKQRKEDIISFCRYFLRNYLPKNRPVPEFSKEVTSLFKRYPWPGNINELSDTMRFVSAVCIDQRIELGDLPRSIRELLSPSFDSQEPLRKQMDRLETEIIRNALERHGRIVTRAAKELGLSESTLRYRMYRLGLSNEKIK